MRVVAVCSTEPHEIEWAKGNEEYNEFSISVYSDYDEMLGHAGLKAVWIATSTDVHSTQSISAIKKGIHVMCEKPLSTDLAEVGKLLATQIYILILYRLNRSLMWRSRIPN